LLATLMALQAGMPLLDFSGIRGRVRQRYFMAVQAAMGRNHEPMQAIFRAVLTRSGWQG
jgi:cell filamentation protein